MRGPRLSAFALFAALGGTEAWSEGFGGPNTVENTLTFDREQLDEFFQIDALDPYFAFKSRLEEQTGINFGFDYSSVVFGGTSDGGEDIAAGGIARLFGTWDLVGGEGPNTGGVVFKFEHRHGYTDVAPSAYGFDQSYVGLLNGPFSDQGFRLTNLYWKQRLLEGSATVTVGFLDTTDYVDAYALANPWTHFGNLVFSTGAGAIGLPDDGTLGIAAGVFLSDNFYVIGGITDANSESNEAFQGFKNFVEERDYFSSVEFGYTTRPDRLIFDNIHVTLWHTDGSERLGVNNGWGANLSASWYVNDQWMPFLRGGYSEDGGALLESSISVGLGWQPNSGPGQDVLGIGLNWGRPNEDSFGPGLDDQWTAEVFYRLNLGKHIALTPSVQLIANPALDPGKDVIGAFGLRARIAL